MPTVQSNMVYGVTWSGTAASESPHGNQMAYGTLRPTAQIETTSSCYVQFDISELLRYHVNTVILHRTRASLFGQLYSTGTVFYYLYTYAAKTAGNPADLFYNRTANLIYVGSLGLLQDKVTSGDIALDISAAFDIHKAASGAFVIGFISSSEDSQATDSNMYLTSDVSYLPSYPPNNLLPVVTQNPHHPITLSWAFTKNSELLADDPQVASEITVWQDGSPQTIISIANANNNYTLPANFFANLNTAHFTVRTQTQYNGWGAMSGIQSFGLALTPPLAPINLLPVATQNPHGVINLSWWFTRNGDLKGNDPQNDPQIASEITVWQDGSAQNTFSIGNPSNNYTLPANYFANYNTAHYFVRTQTQYNGWGAYSGTQSFSLAPTPPLAPNLIYPLNISVNADNGALLEWSYNSPYDTTPTGFDVRWRLDGGAWVQKHVGNTTNMFTDPISGQHTVDWQVLAYGALNDAGPWSVIGTFFSIGRPNPPVIVSVSNSNRPTVNFSAQNMLSWQIQFFQNGVLVYDSGDRAFDGAFSHTLDTLLNNGYYMVQMRITNQYGLTSTWATRPATLNAPAPAAPGLTISRSNNYFVRLQFQNVDPTAFIYIYRAEGSGSYLRIAKTQAAFYDDYTAAPGRIYNYFARAINTAYAFADSGKLSARIDFADTTLADARHPEDFIPLLYQVDAMPKKSRTHKYEKTLSQFVGRSAPVLQVGELTSRSMSFSYFVDGMAYARLVSLNELDGLLVLRNSQFGLIYGTIEGSLNDEPKSLGASDTTRDDSLNTSGSEPEYEIMRRGYVVTFTFTEADYAQEVEL